MVTSIESVAAIKFIEWMKQAVKYTTINTQLYLKNCWELFDIFLDTLALFALLKLLYYQPSTDSTVNIAAEGMKVTSNQQDTEGDDAGGDFTETVNNTQLYQLNGEKPALKSDYPSGGIS